MMTLVEDLVFLAAIRLDRSHERDGPWTEIDLAPPLPPGPP